MSRQLVAVVDVYEITPIGDIIVDNHYFNLAISTFEGWREKDERNN